MITIMNIFNIIVQHKLKYFNIILHIEKRVLFSFSPPIRLLIYVPGHDLKSNASLNLDESLSLIPAMDVFGIVKLHVL